MRDAARRGTRGRTACYRLAFLALVGAALGLWGSCGASEAPAGRAAAAAPAAETIAPDYELGTRLLEAGELAKAQEIFSAIVAADPRHADSYYQIGVIRVRQGDYRAGIDYFHKALEYDPENPLFHLALARMLEFLGAADEAEAAYGKVLRYGVPGSEQAREADRQIRYIRATRDARAGELGAALEQFARLAADYPEHLLTRYSLGVAWLLTGRAAEAEAEFAKVLELDPGYAGAHLNLATIYENRGQVSRAAASLQRVVEADPEGPSAAVAQTRLDLIEARLLIEGGNLAEAAEALVGVLALDPANAAALQLSADVHRRMGDLAGEEQLYRRILELFPDHLEGAVRLAEIYVVTDRIGPAVALLEDLAVRGRDTPPGMQALDLLARLYATEAGRAAAGQVARDRIAAYQTLLEREPENAAAHRELALLYRRQGAPDEARPHFEEAVRLYPDDKDGHALLGAVYDDLGMFSESVAAYAQAIALEPDPGAAQRLGRQLRLGVAKQWYVAGGLAQAAREFDALLAEEPDDIVAHFYLGLIYSREGERLKAVDAYAQVIRLVPTHVGARLNLAFNYERLNREEDALDEYRKILQARPPPEIAASTRQRIAEVEKRIRGFSSSMGFVMSYDNNSNLSTQAPADDLRSDLLVNLAYQHKMHNGVRLRFVAAPVYSTYYAGQFDFLNTATTVSASITPGETTLVGGYAYRTSKGVVAPQRFSDTATLFAEGLTHARLPSLYAPWSPARVPSELSVTASYTDFDSESSPFFSTYTTSVAGSLVQPIGEFSSLGLGYGFVENSNKELLGSDYAYRSHGLNLSIERAVAAEIVVNLKYGYTLFQYTNLDSFSQFSHRRRNTQHSLAAGASYRPRRDLSLFATLSWVVNDSNLPVGFILSTEDVIEGQQSSALSDYRQITATTGINFNF